MPNSVITKDDILNWNSKEEIANTLEKRGLKRTELGNENEIVMELDDDYFIAIIEATGEKNASDYNSKLTSTRKTQVVSTDDYEEFTFTSRRRAWDKHGQIKYKKWSITKDQFRNNTEVRTPLEKLKNIEYGSPNSINELYETKKIVKEFYNQFEEIRAELVNKVSGIPEGEGEKKQDYVQTIFDRLIFLHFIQEKKLLNYNQNYLEDNQEKIIEEGEDVYEEFYRPLFFNWLATDNEHPEHTLPYLNGGLFTKTDVERQFEEVRLGENKEETNQLFSKILDFLGDWNWHADERLDIVDPNRLSPELLGHIFEKTVNQKEMGAYYTPKEITHFMSKNTIQPYILDRINEKFDKNYEEIDELFKIPNDKEGKENDIVIGPIEDIKREEIEYLYFEVLNNIKVLDPAVGSGAFLLAAQEVLLAIYLSALEYFERLDKEKSWEITERIENMVKELEESSVKKSMHAKRRIILNNLYGVDLDKGATEICKLRLWLSIVADLEKGDNPHNVETLPNIDFNIRQGNSLIGFTEPLEKALDDNIEDNISQARYSQFTSDAIYKKYDEIVDKIKIYKEHERKGNREKAKKARQEAFKLLKKYREDPNKEILKQFHEVGIEDVDMDDIKEFSPFHWVLEFAEVYSEGGFDVIIGNPPWDKVKAERDDFFPRYDEIFRQRMPSEKDDKEEELKSDPEIKRKWEEYKNVTKSRSDYYKSKYEMQSASVYGQTLSGDKELSGLFFERIKQLGKESSMVSLILPGVIFTGGSKKPIRKYLMNDAELESLPVFQNKDIFEGLDATYRFGITTFRNSGETAELDTYYSRGNPSVLRDLRERSIKMTQDQLEQYSPEAYTFPFIKSEDELNLLNKITEEEPLYSKEGSWYFDPYSELHRSSDRDRFVEEEEKGDYPVRGGSNIYQFIHDERFVRDIEPPKFWSVYEDKDKDLSAHRRIREKKVKNLKKAIFDEFDGKGSQKGFVNNLLKEERGKKLKVEDALLDSTDYRIVFRHVTNSICENTMIASVIPPEDVCHNALETVKLFEEAPSEEDLQNYPMHSAYERIFSEEELFAALGIVNSLPFDFLVKTKVEENMVMYKIKESQVPKLSSGDDYFEFIWKRAAKLNCYGERYEEMRERLGIEAVIDENKRRELRAEIDAAAMKSYNLGREKAEFLIENFPRIPNPRIKDEDYFGMVLEKYDKLAEEGPMP